MPKNKVIISVDIYMLSRSNANRDTIIHETSALMMVAALILAY